MDVTTDSTTAVAMVAFRPSVRATRIAAGWLDTEAFACFQSCPKARPYRRFATAYPTGIEAAGHWRVRAGGLECLRPAGRAAGTGAPAGSAAPRRAPAAPRARRAHRPG